MKIKSILVKSIAVTALSVTGLVAANNNTNTAQAAIVENDTDVVTVKNVSDNAITVYNSYKNPEATGQTLASNTSWKVIKTAYDAKGRKWYDLGKNQWVRAKYVTRGYKAQAAVTQAPVQYHTESATTSSVANTTQTASATTTSTVSGSEASAKEWIAGRESGGSYSASNGQYVGKYQLSASYLNGDYSAANQERVADNYVKGRYGSWTAAKAFWQANGWY